jgi:hypothetical protein
MGNDDLWYGIERHNLTCRLKNTQGDWVMKMSFATIFRRFLWNFQLPVDSLDGGAYFAARNEANMLSGLSGKNSGIVFSSFQRSAFHRGDNCLSTKKGGEL